MQNNETVSRYQKPVSETDILDNVRNDTPLITITTEKGKTKAFHTYLLIESPIKILQAILQQLEQ